VFSNSEEVLKFISDEKVEYLDIRFCDLPGVMQHLTVPAATAAGVFEDGAAFDGSSVRGFQAINESDMALLPDPATARLDPFRKHKTLNVNFFVHDPITASPTAATPATSRARPSST
jgi:glutamine synthetase